MASSFAAASARPFGWVMKSFLVGLLVTSGMVASTPLESVAGPRYQVHRHSHGRHGYVGRHGYGGSHFGHGFGSHFRLGRGHGHGHFGHGHGHYGHFYPHYFSYSRSYPRYYSYGYPSFGYSYGYPSYGYRSYRYSVPRYHAYSDGSCDCGPYSSGWPVPYAPRDIESSAPSDMHPSTPDPPAAEAPEDDTESSTPTKLDHTAAPSRGWSLLAAGQPVNALYEFTMDAERDLTNGVHKVGYSLAAAAAGDLRRGVWAMRWACRVDPSAVRALDLRKIDERLAGTVQQVMNVYQRRVDNGASDPGTPFILASLHYLAGDNEQAREAIQLAQRRGDGTVSARNLDAAISVRLAHRERDEARLILQPQQEEDVPDPLSVENPTPLRANDTSETSSPPQVLGGREF